MMKKLLPLLLVLAGLGGGAGAGLALRPASAPEADATHDTGPKAAHDDASGDYPAEEKTPGAPAPADHKSAEKADGHDAQSDDSLPDYVKLNNQFIVPVVEDGRVAAMVILSLSLEVQPGGAETVYAREPKLRDVFLQVMFDHANAGSFSGAFTDGANLVLLRTALREVAVRTLGDMVSDVLIVDIVRQDS